MAGSELRARAAGGEVRKTEGPTLAQQIQTMEKQYALAMPKGAEATQLVRDALTCLRQTPKLAECDPTSVLGSLMTCAQLGLRPGVLGHAWLLPFWDSKSRGYKTQLVLGYQGLAELAYRSGKIAGINARTVFENDDFRIAYGTTDEIHHVPHMDGDRGKPVGYYCVAHIKDGRAIFEYMTLTDMEQHRDRHATAKNRDGKIFGPWVDHFEAMAHKTCLRKLAKWMPKSTDLQIAIAVDNGVRFDSNAVPPTDATYHYDGEVVSDTADDTTPAGDQTA